MIDRGGNRMCDHCICLYEKWKKEKVNKTLVIPRRLFVSLSLNISIVCSFIFFLYFMYRQRERPLCGRGSLRVREILLSYKNSLDYISSNHFHGNNTIAYKK